MADKSAATVRRHSDLFWWSARLKTCLATKSVAWPLSEVAENRRPRLAPGAAMPTQGHGGVIRAPDIAGSLEVMPT
jgi:hypothetical protein